MKDKIIEAFKDNHRDLLRAKDECDIEETAFCKGYENAMLFVLGLYGISYGEVMKRRNE